MALFVDLDDEDVEPPQHLHPDKLLWNSTAAALGKVHHMRPTPPPSPLPHHTDPPDVSRRDTTASATVAGVGEARESDATEVLALNWNAMTEALGCYPYADAPCHFSFCPSFALLFMHHVKPA